MSVVIAYSLTIFVNYDIIPIMTAGQLPGNPEHREGVKKPYERTPWTLVEGQEVDWVYEGRRRTGDLLGSKPGVTTQFWQLLRRFDIGSYYEDPQEAYEYPYNIQVCERTDSVESLWPFEVLTRKVTGPSNLPLTPNFQITRSSPLSNRVMVLEAYPSRMGMRSKVTLGFKGSNHDRIKASYNDNELGGSLEEFTFTVGAPTVDASALLKDYRQRGADEVYRELGHLYSKRGLFAFAPQDVEDSDHNIDISREQQEVLLRRRAMRDYIDFTNDWDPNLRAVIRKVVVNNVKDATEHILPPETPQNERLRVNTLLNLRVLANLSKYDLFIGDSDIRTPDDVTKFVPKAIQRDLIELLVEHRQRINELGDYRLEFCPDQRYDDDALNSMADAEGNLPDESEWPVKRFLKVFIRPGENVEKPARVLPEKVEFGSDFEYGGTIYNIAQVDGSYAIRRRKFLGSGGLEEYTLPVTVDQLGLYNAISTEEQTGWEKSLDLLSIQYARKE